jgi:hypothetical protein
MERRRRVQRLTAASSGVAAPRPRHARKIAASTTVLASTATATWCGVIGGTANGWRPSARPSRFQMDLAGRRRLEAVSSVPAIGQTCRPYRRTDSSRTLRDQSKGGLRCETHAAQASRGPGVSFRAELPRVHRILLSSSTADVSTKPRPQPRRRQTDCTQRNSHRDSNRRDADDA